MDEKSLIINETFGSIQGESTHAGKLCFFIRLAGCNLNCSYCDTGYAKKTSDGLAIAIDDLVDRAVQANIPLVEITGGEPLLQDATSLLCEKLIHKGFQVLVETNGALPIDGLPEGVIRILDYKLPSSGETGHMDLRNFEQLKSLDEVKFVVADKGDYEHAKDIINRYDLLAKTTNILMSTVFENMQPCELAEMIISDNLPVRMQLQMHKYIWDPEKRGV